MRSSVSVEKPDLKPWVNLVRNKDVVGFEVGYDVVDDGLMSSYTVCIHVCVCV